MKVVMKWKIVCSMFWKTKSMGCIFMKGIWLINKAIEFATLSRVNQTRKGTEFPYILHCLEARTIAANLTNKYGSVESDVVSAAILHDTIEDAYVSYETLKEVFNENIANLVKSQSEDKSKE